MGRIATLDTNSRAKWKGRREEGEKRGGEEGKRKRGKGRTLLDRSVSGHGYTGL